MTKKIFISILVLSLVLTGFASAYPVPSTKWTTGTVDGWVQGHGEASDDGFYDIFLEIRLYNNALEKIDESSATNITYVYTQTGVHWGYNYNTCVTIGSAFTN